MKRSTLFKFLIGLIIVILGFVIYRALFVADDSAVGGPSLEPVGLGSEEEGSDEFLNILLSLQQIKLSDEVFSDPVFTSLVDFSTELRDQAPGRDNPFAPVGVGGPPRLGETGQPVGNGTGTSTDDF